MKKIVAIILALCVMLSLPACQKKCEHTYTNKVTQEPSCNAAGTRTYTCSLCGDTYAEAIPEIEHTFGAMFVSKEASCVEEGEKSHTCEHCGLCEVVEKTALAKHKYTSKVTVVATCTQKGQKTFTCSVCQDSYTETTPKANHNYTAKITSQATCTTAGVKTYTCSGCNNSYKETIKAKGHSWVNATCTKAKYCSVCNETSGSAKGHNYNSEGVCKTCGITISATIEKAPRSRHHSR